jgi:hypothetical protein
LILIVPVVVRFMRHAGLFSVTTKFVAAPETTKGADVCFS